MILVIFAHSPILPAPRQLIYTFHMPLFFFLSGYLYDRSNYPSFKNIAARKFRSLIIPYFCFAALECSLSSLRAIIHRAASIGDSFGPFIMVVTGLRTILTGTMWFLLCLFVTELLFYALSSRYRDTKKLVASLVVFSIIGFLYSTLVTVPLPLSFDVALTAVVFYGAGYLMKRYKTSHTPNSFLNFTVIFLLLVVINFSAGFSHGRIDMYDNEYHNYFLFYVAAFSGIGWFVMLMKIIKPNRIFTYIGINSIIYLILHQQIILPIIGTVLLYFPWLHAYLNGHAMLYGGFCTISTIIICVPIIYVINNKLYFLLGKSVPSKSLFRAVPAGTGISQP